MTTTRQEFQKIAAAEWPAELRDLKSDQERSFVVEYVENGGNGAKAAAAAGYGNEDKPSAPHTLARIAYRLLGRDHIRDAVLALSKRQMRSLAPLALRAVKETLSETYHKDRMRAAGMVLDRTDAVITKIEGKIEHHHTIDHEEEALNQLRTMRALGVTRDKLAEVFGSFGLERLESKLAIEDHSQTVDAEFTEIQRDPDADILGE